MEIKSPIDSRILTGEPPTAGAGELHLSSTAEASRVSRHVLNTFHSARKAYADDSIQDRLATRFRRLAAQKHDTAPIIPELLEELTWNGSSASTPEITVRFEGTGPVRVVLHTGTLRQPPDAHALVADLWYAAPDWQQSYPGAVRHTTVQLPPDAGMAAFEFFPEKTAHPYIIVAGLRWHLDFRHRDNFSRQPDSFNAVSLVLR
jgi:hypothetical protein